MPICRASASTSPQPMAPNLVVRPLTLQPGITPTRGSLSRLRSGRVAVVAIRTASFMAPHPRAICLCPAEPDGYAEIASGATLLPGQLMSFRAGNAIEHSLLTGVVPSLRRPLRGSENQGYLRRHNQHDRNQRFRHGFDCSSASRLVNCLCGPATQGQ